MFLRVVLFLLFAIPLSFNIQAQDAWSLQQCLEYAWDNNLQLRQASLSEESADITLLQQKLSLVPDLNASGSWGLNFGRSIDPTSNDFINQRIQTASLSVSSGMVLFAGLTNWNAIKQAEYNLLAAQYGFEQSKDAISLSIANAYLGIILAEESVTVAENQVAISESEKERTEALVDNGVLPEGSLLDINAQIASDKLRLVQAEGQLELSYLTLVQLLQLNPTDDFSIVKPETDMAVSDDFEQLTPTEIYEKALLQMAIVKQQEYLRLAAAKGLSIAKGGQSPIISAFANMRTNYSDAFEQFTGVEPTGTFDTIGLVGSTLDAVVTPGFRVLTEPTPFFDQLSDNFSQSVGIQVSIPVFNGWAVRSSIQQAELNMLNADLNDQIVKNQLYQDIVQAYTNAKTSRETYLSAVDTRNALEQSYNFATERYELGLINPIEYNTIRTNLANAEIDVLRSKYDYLFRLKILDFYQGNPLTID